MTDPTAPPTPIHTQSDGTEEWMAFVPDPAGNPLAVMTIRQKS